MKATVTSDVTDRVIRLIVIGAPDLEIVQKYHRKPPVIRPDAATVRFRGGRMTEVSVSGPMVLKSGASSDAIRYDAIWRPDLKCWSDHDKLSTAPQWVQDIADQAFTGVIQFTDEGTDR